MSVLSAIPAEATAEDTARACLDGLEQLQAELGLLAGEGPALVAETRSAVAELVAESERLAELLIQAGAEPVCGVCGGPFGREEAPAG